MLTLYLSDECNACNQLCVIIPFAYVTMWLSDSDSKLVITQTLSCILWSPAAGSSMKKGILSLIIPNSHVPAIRQSC